jgi:uncharacterized protein (TIGR02996 family)
VDERAAFIRAICEEPADDTRRLGFADWLDERDESARAEFIRVQVELGQWEKGAPCECRTNKAASAPHCDRCGPIRHLQIREDRLFSEHWKRWRVDADGAHALGPFLLAPMTSDYADHTSNYFFSRGFASEWVCGLNTFSRRAEEIFVAHPITRVLLLDRLPRPIWVGLKTRQSGYVWDTAASATGDSVIPDALHEDVLHDTHEAAWEWLSERCVSHSRELVAMVPLESNCR